MGLSERGIPATAILGLCAVAAFCRLLECRVKPVGEVGTWLLVPTIRGIKDKSLPCDPREFFDEVDNEPDFYWQCTPKLYRLHSFSAYLCMKACVWRHLQQAGGRVGKAPLPSGAALPQATAEVREQVRPPPVPAQRRQRRLQLRRLRAPAPRPVLRGFHLPRTLPTDQPQKAAIGSIEREPAGGQLVQLDVGSPLPHRHLLQLPPVHAHRTGVSPSIPKGPLSYISTLPRYQGTLWHVAADGLRRGDPVQSSAPSLRHDGPPRFPSRPPLSPFEGSEQLGTFQGRARSRSTRRFVGAVSSTGARAAASARWGPAASRAPAPSSPPPSPRPSSPNSVSTPLSPSVICEWVNVTPTPAMCPSTNGQPGGLAISLCTSDLNCPQPNYRCINSGCCETPPPPCPDGSIATSICVGNGQSNCLPGYPQSPTHHHFTGNQRSILRVHLSKRRLLPTAPAHLLVFR